MSKKNGSARGDDRTLRDFEAPDADAKESARPHDSRLARLSEAMRPAADADLLMWEFDQAPHHYRMLVPLAFTGGWIVLIKPGCDAGLIGCLLTKCHRSGFSVVRCDLDAGGVVLAGKHLAD